MPLSLTHIYSLFLNLSFSLRSFPSTSSCRAAFKSPSDSHTLFLLAAQPSSCQPTGTSTHLHIKSLSSLRVNPTAEFFGSNPYRQNRQNALDYFLRLCLGLRRLGSCPDCWLCRHDLSRRGPAGSFWQDLHHQVGGRLVHRPGHHLPSGWCNPLDSRPRSRPRK